MGGKNTAHLTVDESVSAVLKTTAHATLAQSGSYIDRNGIEIPY